MVYRHGMPNKLSTYSVWMHTYVRTYVRTCINKEPKLHKCSEHFRLHVCMYSVRLGRIMSNAIKIMKH